MIRVCVTIKGVSPLLMDPMPDERLEGIRTKTSPTKRLDWSREEEAATKMYCDIDGAVGVPSLNLFACLVEAGRKVKVKARQISTADSTILPALLTIEEFFLRFKGDPEWIADMRRGCNEKKQTVALVRPRFDDWEFDVTLEIDETEVNEETIRQLVETAGKKIGICSFRPACRGPFGRFEVAKWARIDGSQDGKVEISEEELAAAAA